MTRLTLQLSEEMEAKLSAHANRSGYESLEQYVEAFLRSEAQSLTDAEEDYGAPDHLRMNSEEGLEERLLEGLGSGPEIEVTDAAWQNIGGEVARRIRGGRPPAGS